MITYLQVTLGVLALAITGFYACGGSTDVRRSVGGSGDSPQVATQQEPGSDAVDSSDNSGEDGTTDSDTDNGANGTNDPKPVIKDVGFSCGPGQIKFKIDDKPVDSYAAEKFFSSDKGENFDGGIFPYEFPGSFEPDHRIAVFASGIDKKPGDTFGGWISINRGADGKAGSCQDNASENYFKYIDGNATAPLSRHIEGVVVNLYKDQDCKNGEITIKKFSFCINAINPE